MNKAIFTEGGVTAPPSSHKNAKPIFISYLQKYLFPKFDIERLKFYQAAWDISTKHTNENYQLCSLGAKDPLLVLWIGVWHCSLPGFREGNEVPMEVWPWG